MIAFLRLSMAALLLLTGGVALAQPDSRCNVPDDLVYTDEAMPRVAKKLKEKQLLRVVVLGSSSSMQTTKGLPRSYAVGLPDALGNLLGIPLQIDNLSERTLTAAQMAAMIAARVTVQKPDLVIWQTGNVDAAQQVDINSFTEALQDGLARLRAAGIDTLLVSPQYRMRLSIMVDVAPYDAAMEQIAAAEGVAVFQRYDIMRHWAEEEVFDTRSSDMAMQMREAEAQNHCLAGLLARVVKHATRQAP